MEASLGDGRNAAGNRAADMQEGGGTGGGVAICDEIGCRSAERRLPEVEGACCSLHASSLSVSEVALEEDGNAGTGLVNGGVGCANSTEVVDLLAAAMAMSPFE